MRSCTAVEMVSKHVRLPEHDARLHEARAQARGMSFSELVRTALAWHAGYEAGLETTLEGRGAPAGEKSVGGKPG